MDMIHHECVDPLYELALDARGNLDTNNDQLRLRMQHFLDADCECISALTGEPIAKIREEVERHYERRTISG